MAGESLNRGISASYGVSTLRLPNSEQTNNLQVDWPSSLVLDFKREEKIRGLGEQVTR